MYHHMRKSTSLNLFLVGIDNFTSKAKAVYVDVWWCYFIFGDKINYFVSPCKSLNVGFSRVKVRFILIF